MQLALDSQNRRVLAAIGQEAICPCCHSSVKAFCGETNIFHWRHVNRADCDIWYEPESQWHINWKNEFPLNWREIVINKDSIIHRADVLTSNGVVLELQNSSISAETIREREVFYNRMVWLINCTRYKNNIKTNSLLEIKLNEHREENEHIFNYNPEDAVDIRDEKRQLRVLNENLDDYKDQRNRTLSKKELFESTLKHLTEETLNYLKWFSHSYIHFSAFKFEEKETYRKTLSEIENVNKQIVKIENILKSIEELPKCEINGYGNYVYIDKRGVKDSNFDDYILVDTRTINELFPTVFKARSELDFSLRVSLEYNLVGLDPQRDIQTFKGQLENCRTDKERLEALKMTLINKCEISLKNFTQPLLQVTNQEINEINHSIGEIELEKSKLQEEISEKIERQLEFGQNQIDKSIVTYNYEREKIIEKYTGMFTLTWKYRHRSWDNSTSKKFLDMGNYILEVLDFKHAKKISKAEFVELVNNLRPPAVY